MAIQTLDHETNVAIDDQSAFTTMLGRLEKLSVEKHFDAYADIPWDDQDHLVVPGDPRFRLPSSDPIAMTDWYRGLAPEAQSEVSMYRFASCMRTGWHFENLLQRGLLVH